MIKIRLSNGTEATFSGSSWKCNDRVIQKMLNDTLDLDEVTASDAYRVFKKAVGLDAVALEAVRHLRPKLVENVPLEIPAEEKGVMV